MIKLFRKIRKNLLAEGKKVKYLKYALGEIVLVVIGILIALQINNWNDERKSNIENIKFLSNLRDEIALDTLALVEIIPYYEGINEDLIKTLQYLREPTDINQEKREIVSRALVNFAILTPVFKNIEKNNSKLSEGVLININNELNSKFQQYLDYVKSSSEKANKFGESLQLMAINDVHTHVDLDFVFSDRLIADFNFEELKNSRLVKNDINKSIRFRGIYIKWMKEEKIKAIELLNLLVKELK
ncbi:DUF6090 family protein [Gaetbulibacter aestuarii]|uniref:DUF6090 family protein n=1 Tax=Gaetbulibacter aestuarii TaxID=1502358 RepID=A0ABW7MYV7_9FLAO